MRDLIIIGAGPGGFDTAIYAKEMGLDVVLIEKHKLGGTCLNYGCIPTKALYHNAKKLKELKSLEVFGINVENFSVDYDVIRTRKETIVSNQIKNILTTIKKLKIDLIEGEATILDNNTVLVNGEEIKTKNIIIATGSSPKKLNFPGNDLDVVKKSKDILALELFPKKMVVIGAGVIGSEMASIFNQFDCEVSLVEYQDEILPPLDKEIKKRARNLYKRSGIDIYTNSSLIEVIKKDDKFYAIVESKGKQIEIETDFVLVSTGRKPNFGNLDLDKLGIDYTDLGIEVDENFATNVPNVYAIGDVTGILMLAHKATYDGYKTVAHILGKDMNINFNQVPSVVFTLPEIATVGVIEEELEGTNYQKNKFMFKTNAKAQCLNETDGFIKMLVDEKGILVGCHIIGPHASDLIHEVTSVMYTKISIEDYKNIIHAHPTISEVVGECIKGFH
ncbi:Dihydrolipoyl dehydrogenase [Candidatus Izimaplasma bacterium HR1]|jgi:dihydrolipoamide dehydrogenase|uniref:dihydrolipoyl dehydrogenase n=1 Tax=Candidatus Izimoplasma sp. HR1 TaxID=1541959 RepID=UPI0004F82A73|nr:Dihydrolipoyl dehydrogenase [Candidatus Izimaplasma bacterium HR1]